MYIENFKVTRDYEELLLDIECTYSPLRSATMIDPEEGGLEIQRITLDNVEWADELTDKELLKLEGRIKDSLIDDGDDYTAI